MTARKKRPARDGATPEKIKSGRKTGKTPSKDRPYHAILRRWAFRPNHRAAFLLPFRAPPPAPCIRHTSAPRTAGARHGNPLRFDFAWQRNARCISKCMRLLSTFFARPAPLGRRVDIADDGLPSLGYVDVLDDHLTIGQMGVI